MAYDSPVMFGLSYCVIVYTRPFQPNFIPTILTRSLVPSSTIASLVLPAAPLTRSTANVPVPFSAKSTTVVLPG